MSRLSQIEPQELRELYKITCTLLSRSECEPFREPVDWQGLGLTDYPEVIAKPMDLGTVKRNIENEVYTTVDEAVYDVRLVWANCMLYNNSGSEFYHLGDKFSKCFEDTFRASRLIIDPTHFDPHRIPSVEEKLQFSHDLFKLGNHDLTKLLTLLEERAPGSLARKLSTDELLVNVDLLQADTFHTANAFVLGCIAKLAQGRRGKKRKSSDEGSGRAKVLGSNNSTQLFNNKQRSAVESFDITQQEVDEHEKEGEEGLL